MGMFYLRTAEEVCAFKGGAVVACIGEVDLWETIGAVDSGDKGELEDINVGVLTIIGQSLLCGETGGCSMRVLAPVDGNVGLAVEV